MKKTLILALVAISLSSVNAVASNKSNLLNVSPVNPVEQSTGMIIELNENGGKILEDGTGIIRDFEHPGALVIFSDKAQVTYLLITTPNGRIITKDIRHK
ncbi:MAG: hypothetical protein H7141_02440 [Burkholderiales bacterium]|nr:hypothetical protein [Bacteroidia bacterium]